MSRIKILLLTIIIVGCVTSCKKKEVGTCSDGIQNQTETGVDCGGTCGACATCSDGTKNGTETGIDCGGECTPCPTCTDGIMNGNETGVDCGGSCSACVDMREGKVKTYTHPDDNGITITENYFYDSQGRQILATYSNGDSTFTSYSTNTVTQIYGSGHKKIYTINAQGYAATSDESEYFNYDTAGHLIMANKIGGVWNYQWWEGNCIRIDQIHYRFDLFKLNTIDNKGLDFLGKPSKNLVDSDDSVAAGCKYTYEYDFYNRVSKMTKVCGSATEVYQYTYY